jgi:hypothetical protein
MPADYVENFLTVQVVEPTVDNAFDFTGPLRTSRRGSFVDDDFDGQSAISVP